MASTASSQEDSATTIPLPTGATRLWLRSREDCPICLEECNEPVALTCGHITCRACLEHWQEASRSCPTCRAPITDPRVITWMVARYMNKSIVKFLHIDQTAVSTQIFAHVRAILDRQAGRAPAISPADIWGHSLRKSRVEACIQWITFDDLNRIEGIDIVFGFEPGPARLDCLSMGLILLEIAQDLLPELRPGRSLRRQWLTILKVVHALCDDWQFQGKAIDMIDTFGSAIVDTCRLLQEEVPGTMDSTAFFFVAVPDGTQLENMVATMFRDLVGFIAYRQTTYKLRILIDSL